MQCGRSYRTATGAIVRDRLKKISVWKTVWVLSGGQLADGHEAVSAMAPLSSRESAASLSGSFGRREKIKSHRSRVCSCSGDRFPYLIVKNEDAET